MPVAPWVRLDDQLCFALYAATNAVTRAYRPLLRDIRLSYPQYLALMVLWEEDGLSVSEIAARLDLPGNALTPLLARLTQLGYVARARDGADGRVLRIGLTELGAELEHKAAAVQHQVVCSTGLDEESLAALRTRLHDLVDSMRAPAACDRPAEGDAP